METLKQLYAEWWPYREVVMLGAIYLGAFSYIIAYLYSTAHKSVESAQAKRQVVKQDEARKRALTHRVVGGKRKGAA